MVNEIDNGSAVCAITGWHARGGVKGVANRNTTPFATLKEVPPCGPFLRVVFLLLLAGVTEECLALEEGDNFAPPLVGSARELLDLRSFSTLKPWRVYQESSYDRAGGYYDSGHFVRIEADRQLVLLDLQGPGCIDRMWFTRKKPRQEIYELRLYIDDLEKPAFQADLDEAFSGKLAPFAAPLAGACGLKDAPGLYSYVPIGFRQRCKVVLVPTAPDDRYLWRTTETGEKIRHVYYQITYRTLTAETPVRTFRREIEPEEAEAVDRLHTLWNRAGQSPWGDRGLIARNASVTVAPKSVGDVFQLSGPAVVYELKLKAKPAGDARQMPASLTESLHLDIAWDKASSPQVSAPLAAFFAAPDARRNVAGLWSGCRDGTYYTYLPMPFAASANVKVRNTSDIPVAITAELKYREESPRTGDGRLFARRYDLTPPKGQDYLILNQQGAGHVVALAMDRPGHMEGDDRWWIDGEAKPSIHGTGTEDFFNFAWGLGGAAAYPLHGMTQHFGRAVCYRFLYPAGVPFQRSIRVTCEHGHDWPDGPNLHLARYSGVVLFYASPQGDVAGPTK